VLFVLKFMFLCGGHDIIQYNIKSGVLCKSEEEEKAYLKCISSSEITVNENTNRKWF